MWIPAFTRIQLTSLVVPRHTQSRWAGRRHAAREAIEKLNAGEVYGVIEKKESKKQRWKDRGCQTGLESCVEINSTSISATLKNK